MTHTTPTGQRGDEQCRFCEHFLGCPNPLASCLSPPPCRDPPHSTSFFRRPGQGIRQWERKDLPISQTLNFSVKTHHRIIPGPNNIFALISVCFLIILTNKVFPSKSMSINCTTKFRPPVLYIQEPQEAFEIGCGLHYFKRFKLNFPKTLYWQSICSSLLCTTLVLILCVY